MHLFAGVGGGLLADLILGHTPIVAVEWDAYACQVLRERAAEGWFPDLSVWEGDVRLFDPSEYAGKVDCIHAGFPCQDISVAGNQAGVGHETRSGLYREVLRVAGIVRPRYLFLENVAAILGNGLGTVLADLAAMGFSAEWGCIRASDCGAPHHRDRWFLLAHSESAECKRIRSSRKRGFGFTDEGTDVSNSDSDKRRTSGMGQDAWADRRNDVSGVCEVLADPFSERQQGQRQSLNAFDSTSAETWQTTDVINGCVGDFWTTESFVGRVANGISNRVHRLKGLGNAQVPLHAAVAWQFLGGE